MTAANDNYGEYPLSITEIKGDLTPRDALITTLREMDKGKLKFDGVVVIGISEDTAYMAYGTEKSSQITDLAICQLIKIIGKDMEREFGLDKNMNDA